MGKASKCNWSWVTVSAPKGKQRRVARLWRHLPEPSEPCISVHRTQETQLLCEGVGTERWLRGVSDCIGRVSGGTPGCGGRHAASSLAGLEDAPWSLVLPGHKSRHRWGPQPTYFPKTAPADTTNMSSNVNLETGLQYISVRVCGLEEHIIQSKAIK